jgi:hypothetical protein
VTRYAPVLQEVAGRLSGESPSLLRDDPVRWAYALRDAVELAQPDVVVSHVDARLEADAVLGSGPPTGDRTAWLGNVPDLATLPPTAAAVELVETLAGIYRSDTDPPVAATLTGPVTLAARLAPELLPPGADEDARVDLADLAADLLAALAGAYVGAGASLLLVVEPESDFLPTDPGLMGPIARAAAHRRLELVVSDLRDGIPSAVWSLRPDELAVEWERLEAGADDLLLSDGPVPADIPLENLRHAHDAHRRRLD